MPNPELILHNGMIYPEADKPRTAEALAVWKGRILQLGSNREILKLRARSVEVLDLKGRSVIPGLSDSHIHLLGYGTLLRTLDLRGTRSIGEVQRAVVAAAKKRPKASWIVGRGWDQEKLREGRYPNREDLDVAGSRPVLLKRISGHVGVVNSPAMAIAGIDRNTSNPEGGEIQKDPSDGEPTGVLKEQALDLVQRTIPEDEREAAVSITTAAKRLVRLGLTSLHCIVENLFELKLLRRLKHEGKIPQSLYAILPLSLLKYAVTTGLRTETREAGFRVGGVKLYLDGSLGARTAALGEPYSDDPGSTGMLTMARDDVDQVVGDAAGSGFQLLIHAIGDRAVEEAVRAIKKANSPARRGRLRHRIEHSSLTPPSLLPSMRKNGTVCSVQPRFIYSDSWALKRLGLRRISNLHPFRSILRAGVGLAFGSDAPAEDPNPFEGVWSAVTRPGLPSNERLTARQAFASYTKGSAYASFSEAYAGTLEPGKRADMVLLDQDPFRCEPSELRNIHPLATFLEGRAAWSTLSPKFEKPVRKQGSARLLALQG